MSLYSVKYDMEMPILTPTYWEVPYKFGKFPKSLKKYVLDNYSGYMDVQDIIDWAKKHNTPMVRGASQTTILYDSNTLHPPAGGGCTAGSEVEIGSTANSSGIGGGKIRSFPITLTNARCYDQMALSLTGSGVNVRLGIWEDTSGDPDALSAETGSYSGDSAYTYQSTSEWTTTQTDHWIGEEFQSTLACHYASGGSIKFKTHTFGPMPDPFGTPSTTSGNTHHLKISHT